MGSIIPAVARDSRLTEAPLGFVDDLYPFYAALRAHDPVHAIAADCRLVMRHAGVVALLDSLLDRLHTDRAPLRGWSA